MFKNRSDLSGQIRLECIADTCNYWGISLHQQEEGFLDGHVLYCITLYLCVYVAPLTVRTNQRRFQSERSEKKCSLKRKTRVAPVVFPLESR